MVLQGLCLKIPTPSLLHKERDFNGGNVNGNGREGGSMRLAHLVLGPMILLLLAGCACVLSTSSGNLRTFVGCAVREFTFLAKKPGCRGLRITTDACWGRCETWEKPILEPPYIEAYHRVCTYNETKQVTVKLPNCAPGVDPFYTYPMAVRCDCGACSTATTECETI